MLNLLEYRRILINYTKTTLKYEIILLNTLKSKKLIPTNIRNLSLVNGFIIQRILNPNPHWTYQFKKAQILRELDCQRHIHRSSILRRKIKGQPFRNHTQSYELNGNDKSSTNPRHIALLFSNFTMFGKVTNHCPHKIKKRRSKTQCFNPECNYLGGSA